MFVEDLQGIEVDHDLNDFEAGTSKILVAQDVDVLDAESGDIRLVSLTDQSKKQASQKPAVALSFADEDESETVHKKV